MRKSIFLILIFLLSFVCSACTKVAFDIEINDNDKVNVNENQVVDIKKISSNTEAMMYLMKDLENLAESYKLKGRSAVSFMNDYSAGLIFSKNNLDFKDVLLCLPSSFDKQRSKGITKEISFIKTRYNIHFYYDIAKNYDQINLIYTNFLYKSSMLKYLDLYSIEPLVFVDKVYSVSDDKVFVNKKYASGRIENVTYSNEDAKNIKPDMPFQVEIVIKIPRKAIVQNATEVISDNEYKWVIHSDSNTQEIVLIYDKYNFANIFTLLSIFLIVFVVIAFNNRLKEENPIKGL